MRHCKRFLNNIAKLIRIRDKTNTQEGQHMLESIELLKLICLVIIDNTLHECIRIELYANSLSTVQT